MFVTLEGIDRSGKTTQAALLADALGPRTLLLREPGGTEVGERIREMITEPGFELGPRGELLLFSAARAELAAQVIAPASDAGRDVVCDRYVDSSAAYQGAALGALHLDRPEGAGRGAREIGIELIEELNRLVVGDCMPDLTILVRIGPEAAARRREGPGGGSDRFESRGIEFQREVAEAYDELARRHPERIAVVDGEASRENVHASVLEIVEARR